MDTPVASTSKGISNDTKSDKVGKLVVREHKLVKTKRVRSFKCVVCQVVTHSTMEYNQALLSQPPSIKLPGLQPYAHQPNKLTVAQVQSHQNGRCLSVQ